MNVELVSSDSFQDIYNVEGSYTLRAVNETKIFESFSITDSSSNVTTITQNPYTDTITEIAPDPPSQIAPDKNP